MSGYVIRVGESEIVATSSLPGVAAYNLTVNVVRAAKTRTARGQTEVSSTVVTNMPADITWLSGKERLKFNKDTHLMDGVLRCRVPAGVTIIESDRIVYGGVTYEITDVKDVKNLGLLLEITIKKC